ncbi:MAG: yagR, partial [Sphingomonas bacterium]|nr:yagR [Sphingomonas bacterium]
MKFDQPAGANPIDQGKVVGHALARIDGPLKVTGAAPYAYEYHDPAPNVAYGVIVTSGIATGTIDRIDTVEAARAPGVLLVMTHQNAPRMFGKPEEKQNTTHEKSNGDQDSKGKHSAPQLQGAQIKQFGQAVAFVVAETFEQATAAAAMVRVGYTNTPGRFSLAAGKATAKPNSKAKDALVGDFEGAFGAAPVKVDVTYSTPNQAQSMMEPHATLAIWSGDQLTLYTAHQVMHWSTEGVADTLGIPHDAVRSVSAYVGGGFGSKLEVYGDAVLAAAAARQLKRPVKCALTRPQTYNHTTHRPPTIQQVRLAATRDGMLTAVGHRTWTGDQDGERGELASDQTRIMYAGANRSIETFITPLDLPKGGSMRAPGEAAGLLALECAMDELAEQLELDPVELRIRNDVQYDPTKGPARPFSDRRLIECLKKGADAFGWAKRNPKPGQVRDGRWLVGYGISAGIRNNMLMPSGTRVTLRPDGTLLVETAMTDIGTGSYTINAQTAAEMLGVSYDRVTIRLGDSALPKAAGSG